MSKEFSAKSLDVHAFAKAGARLVGRDALARYERLSAEAQDASPDAVVEWAAEGEVRRLVGLGEQVWLTVQARALLPMVCQRCLTAVEVPLEVDRSFRFVADEATAEALDDESEEDLLALSQEFDLHALIEDELLMAIPLVPRHEVCPTEIPMASSQQDFDEASAEKPHPFAVLASLRKPGV